MPPDPSPDARTLDILTRLNEIAETRDHWRERMETVISEHPNEAVRDQLLGLVRWGLYG